MAGPRRSRASPRRRTSPRSRRRRPSPGSPSRPRARASRTRAAKPSTGKGGGKDRVPGNNGTVKITPLGETDGTPNNHPHVGCSFQVEWYGYDKGDDIVSRVSFAMHAPTSNVGLSVSGPSSVFVGGDAASGAGTATGLDGREIYTLSFDGAGHPKQGYHVKLTVTTPYSQGNDTKTKVFWVQGCEDTEVPPTEQPPTEQPPTDQPPTEQPPTEQPPAEVPPVIVTPPQPVTRRTARAPRHTTITTTSPGFPPLVNRGPGTPPQSGTPADVPTVVEAGLQNNAATTGSSVPLILVASAPAWRVRPSCRVVVSWRQPPAAGEPGDRTRSPLPVAGWCWRSPAPVRHRHLDRPDGRLRGRCRAGAGPPGRRVDRSLAHTVGAARGRAGRASCGSASGDLHPGPRGRGAGGADQDRGRRPRAAGRPHHPRVVGGRSPARRPSRAAPC